MKRYFVKLGLPLLLTSALTACDNGGGRTRSPSTEVTVVHVSQSFGTLEFRRVERLEATLNYGDSSVLTWDSGPYIFNIDRVVPGILTPVRLYSFTAELEAGNDYSILLTDTGGQLRELLVEAPVSELSASEAEFVVAHAAAGVGPMDVYLEPQGADVAAADRRATLDFRETLSAVQIASGTYEVTLTEVDNPNDVIMASRPFELAGSVRTTLSIINGLRATSPAALLASGGGTDTYLADRELRAGIRALNAMTSRDALDVTVDSNFSPPLLPGVPFAVPSRYTLLVPGEYDLTVSPAGNPGVIEIDQAFNAPAGERATWFLSGDPGALTATPSPDSQRLIRGQATVTVYFGGTLVTGVDVFITPPDTELGTVPPATSLSRTTTVSRLRLGLGGYAVTVREAGTANILAGPVAAAIGVEGGYGILITNGAAGSGVDITLLDGFNAEPPPAAVNSEAPR